jgi:hypothetical protein
MQHVNVMLCPQMLGEKLRALFYPTPIDMHDI